MAVLIISLNQIIVKENKKSSFFLENFSFFKWMRVGLVVSNPMEEKKDLFFFLLWISWKGYLNGFERVDKMAPAAGFEPATKWLTATYSTAELCRSDFCNQIRGMYFTV